MAEGSICHNCGRGIVHNPYGHSSSSLRPVTSGSSSDLTTAVHTSSSTLSFGTIEEGGKLFCCQECYWSEILDEQNSRKKKYAAALRRTKGFVTEKDLKRADDSELVSTTVTGKRRPKNTQTDVSDLLKEHRLVHASVKNDKHAMWVFHECSGMIL